MNEHPRRAVVALTTSYPLRETDWAGVFIRRLYAAFGYTNVSVVCPAVDRPPDPSPLPHVRVHAARYAPRAWQTLAQRSGGVAPGLKRRPWRFALLPGMLVSMGVATWRLAKTGGLIHANWAVCGAIAAPVAWVRRVPLVTTLRGDDVNRAAKPGIDRWLLKVTCHCSSIVVCVSDAMAVSLKALVPGVTTKVHVVRNGVDDAFLTVPRRQCEASEPMHIGAAGSLIPRKGFDVLLAAIHGIRHLNVRVSIIGAGPEEPALRDMCSRLGLDGCVAFLGELPPTAMPGFFSTLDVFVLSSRSEGRPNVVIEALAAGVPVVSSSLPGVEGLVTDATGWRVPVDDATALAAALEVACKDPAGLWARGAAARANMLADGGWARAAAEYEALFARAITVHEESR
jgi:glycosyltransferase involved in cell wall biosynthesis